MKQHIYNVSPLWAPIRQLFLNIFPCTAMTACERVQHVQQFKTITVMKLLKSHPIIKELHC